VRSGAGDTACVQPGSTKLSSPPLHDLSAVTTFKKVVESGSFTAAAHELQMTLSAVSRQVSRLEQALGAQLIARTTRALRLTQAGQVFYDHCARGLRELDHAVEAVSQSNGELNGVLRVITTTCFGRLHVVPAVLDFLALHPKLVIDLSWRHAEESFLGNKADILIRSAPVRGKTIGRQKLVPVRHVICATAEYLKRYGTPRTPKDLASHNCLVITQPAATNEWPFYQGNRRRHLAVSGNFRADTMEALYSAAISGIGVARLPIYVVGADLKSGRLKQLFQTSTQAHAGDSFRDEAMMAAYYLKNRYPDLRTLAFVDFLKTRFQSNYDWYKRDSTDLPY
jgi:DNA-binding transcriptional LysR family regulator